MTIGFIGNAAAIDTGGSSGTGATTNAIDTTGATLLILFVANYKYASGGINPIISDSKSNTWIGLTQNLQDIQCYIQLFYVENPTVGPGHTFTYTLTGAFGGLCVQAFSGTLLVGVNAGIESYGQNDSGTSVQPGTVTPLEDNCVIVTGRCSGETIIGEVIDSGFTITDSIPTVGGTAFGVAMAYLIQGVAAALNPIWSWTNIDETNTNIAVFKPYVIIPYTPHRNLLGLAV